MSPTVLKRGSGITWSNCSNGTTCIDVNASCYDDICKCDPGYYEKDGHCCTFNHIIIGFIVQLKHSKFHISLNHNKPW